MGRLIIGQEGELSISAEMNAEIDMLIKIEKINDGQDGDPAIDEFNLYEKRTSGNTPYYKLIFSKRYIKPGKEIEEKDENQ